MSGSVVLSVIVVYFALLMFIARLTSRRAEVGNSAFFLGNRKSPWWIVAIGMVGASLSGVSFISVPGMVGPIQFNYLQTVFGFFFGYLFIANVLLPLYYKLNLTTIYAYLEQRLGRKSYKTSACFFLLSKLTGAAVRLYVVVLILQRMVFSAWGIPFWLTACFIVLMIWLYTSHSGIKTIVWTDTLQTIILILTLVLIIVQALRMIDLPIGELASQITQSGMTRIFVWDDWHSKQHFVKQFFSGIFIAIVMTGLDQDMMQKNLTCRNLKEAKKNMYWYGFSFIPVNILFLTLGALLLFLAQQQQIALPTNTDDILPLMASSFMGETVAVLFVVGIVAAAFSSADSALTALTTSFAVDILEVEKKNEQQAMRLRKRTHIGISLLFVLMILVFQALNNTSLIDAIYVIASYTYGPLLGMFAFGLYTKRKTNDKAVPFIAVLSPILCYLLDFYSKKYFGYAFGYELLMLNGLLVFVGMWAIDSQEK